MKFWYYLTSDLPSSLADVVIIGCLDCGPLGQMIVQREGRDIYLSPSQETAVPLEASPY